MKLSKTLLSAILIGVAVQGTTSCKKANDSKKQEAQKKEESKKAPNVPCPACGMG
jgi:hypothetical protein